MNESTDIYSTYNIDKSKLKRDYLTNPLKKINGIYEKPFKEDILYLYIELNLNQSVLSKIFNLSNKVIINDLKLFNIKKDKSSIVKNRKQTCLEKYGETSYTKTKEYNNKTTQTCLKKYGATRYAKKMGWKDEYEQIMVNKYGVNNSFQLESVKEKSKETCKRKYGVENYSQSTEMRQYMKTRDVNTHRVYNEYVTKRQHQTMNSSQQELRIYKMLLTKFSDTIHQYRDNVRYPFNCDFYIPSKDLFIEYQGNWYHGPLKYHCPFNENNQEHQQVISDWYNKSKELGINGKPKTQYLRAANNWSIRDPLKRKTAKDNNLNYLEFFSEKEFKEWFDKQ
jgi:hypothetical protein